MKTALAMSRIGLCTCCALLDRRDYEAAVKTIRAAISRQAEQKKEDQEQ